jgi:uncharacterized damage-inducible protein DinB
MNAKDILALFDYNYWANNRILNAAARLTNEQFTAPGNLSFGGVRGTLVHAFGAEYLWRKRTQERTSPSAMPPESEYADLAFLRARWDEEESRMRSFLESLPDEALQESFRYKNVKGIEFESILWQALAHVVNHGTQHRAEVAVLLTDFGQSPGDVDMLLFLREKGSK